MDIYTSKPEAYTANFHVRLLSMEDAPNLYFCYHDKAAVARMNADNCDFGFYAETPEDMAATVEYWLQHYRWRSFVRFAIEERYMKKVVGTIEGFCGEVGVLRLDIASDYEQAEWLAELLRFAERSFRDYFGNRELVTKAVPEATERSRVLEACGWTYIGDYRGYADYYRIALV